MSKRQSLLFIGIFTLVLPFLGVPSSWKVVLTMAIGIILVTMAYFMKREGESSQISTKKTGSSSVFVESNAEVTHH